MGYLLNLLKTFIFEMYCKNRALHENAGVYLFRVCACKDMVGMQRYGGQRYAKIAKIRHERTMNMMGHLFKNKNTRSSNIFGTKLHI